MKILGICIGKEKNIKKNISTYKIKESYVNFSLKGGFLPIFIPYLKDEEKIREVVGKLDLLILSGGIDISTFTYGEDPKERDLYFDFKRDESEFKLAKIAHEEKIPTLAICRGFQLVNILYGGSLYQDLENERENSLFHVQGDDEDLSYHYVEIFESSLSRALEIQGNKKIVVNSNHHQGIRDLGASLKNIGQASDGLIEAIEDESWPMIGLQWHPEEMDGEMMVKILKYLGEKNENTWY